MKNEYDIMAKIYDPALHIFLNRLRVESISILQEYKNKRVIDLCCGTGEQLYKLEKAGFTNLYGIDLSESMLSIAKKKSSKIDFIYGDATETSFEDNFFDVVSINFAIHETTIDKQKAIINEAHRILNPNGILYIIDYNLFNASLYAKFGVYTIERIAGKEHYNNFKNFIKNGELFSLIDEKDFKIESIRLRLLNTTAIYIIKKVKND